jgi:glyoxylase-like metal-dependent hydrolase (beta-lactamase superfamily II)
MTIKSFTFNPFSTNCYLVESGDELVVIDPSSQAEAEHKRLIDAIEERDGTLTRILLTHAHIDHIFGCARLSHHFDVGIEVHASEKVLLQRAETQAAMFGVELESPPDPVAIIEPGTNIEFGEVSWEVLHTPGHSPGSVSFVDRKEGVVFAGDVLFAGSIGRTDLWQGSLPTLMQSIFGQLIPLGDEFRVLSGHGPETSIGRERTSNPFLLGNAPI